ncbi:MAG TPA: DUF4124 domain-containing protein [Geobacteraceae bacterium]
MKYLIVCAVLSLLATSAGAEIYKWVDERGIASYADDLGKVPKRFRNNAVIVDAAVAPVEVVERTDETKDSKKTNSGPDSGKADGSAIKGERAKAVYGGKNEDVWRKEFAKTKADIKGVEEFLAETKARLKDTEKMSRSEYLSLQNTVKDSEIRLAGLRSKLESLTEAANKANVPNELR